MPGAFLVLLCKPVLWTLVAQRDMQLSLLHEIDTFQNAQSGIRNRLSQYADAL